VPATAPGPRAAPVAAHRLPEVIAHRGSSAHEPEHTLAAYLRAIDEGADALECDVRLTADAHLVCVHDRRVNRTSNGKGVVSTLELATLEGLDWGTWKQDHPQDTEMPDADHGRNQLLTLRRLLTTALEADREIGLAIETKHPTRYAGLVEIQLARVLADYGLDRAPAEGRPHPRVMSFSQLAIQRMGQLCPQLPLVYLMEGYVPLRFRDGSLPKGVSIAGISTEMLRRHPETVARQHARGHQVYVYTVDELGDVQRCLAAGVDAIITNRPAFVRDHLETTLRGDVD
jgi:glycerophosphoryl diester phosphodiesterase